MGARLHTYGRPHRPSVYTVINLFFWTMFMVTAIVVAGRRQPQTLDLAPDTLLVGHSCSECLQHQAEAEESLDVQMRTRRP